MCEGVRQFLSARVSPSASCRRNKSSLAVCSRLPSFIFIRRLTSLQACGACTSRPAVTCHTQTHTHMHGASGKPGGERVRAPPVRSSLGSCSTIFGSALFLWRALFSARAAGNTFFDGQITECRPFCGRTYRAGPRHFKNNGETSV